MANTSDEETLAEQVARLLSNLQPNNPIQSTPQVVTISAKLNQNNYPLWARLMRMAIGARGKLSHITGVPEPPPKESTEYARWEQDNLSVCSWILDNMESDMVANYAEYPSAKDLWDGLASTFSQGIGGIQLYELNVKANTARQGTESIEGFYSRLQRIWREIEARQPNPMVCSEDIGIFNRLRSETKLYQLLAGIGEEFEAERRDLLKQDPLPTPEIAYASIRRERDRKVALGLDKTPSSTEGSVSGGIGSGFLVQSEIAQAYAGHHRYITGKEGPVTRRVSNRGNLDRARLKCSNCGKSRHTKEECYYLFGFPEGWTKPKQSSLPNSSAAAAAATKAEATGDSKKESNQGRAQNVVATEGSTSNFSCAFFTENETLKGFDEGSNQGGRFHGLAFNSQNQASRQF